MAKRNIKPSSGPSQRQLRVGEVIRRALSEILMRGEHHISELSDISITVAEVRPSPDLRQATAFVLPLGGRDTETVIDALNRSKGELRREVTRRVKLKFSPDLLFVADESFDRMDETRRMLSEDRVKRDLSD